MDSSNNKNEINNHNASTISKDSSQNKDSLQVVIGLGASGLASVNYLVNQGYSVAVTDGNPSPVLAKKLPDSVNIRKFGEIDADLLIQASRIVISPGVPLEQPAVAKALSYNVPVVSDIQVFHEALQQWEHDVPIIAITGSNAKSTVTTLVGEMAEQAGVNVGVGGNIGLPSLSLLNNPDMELAVLELSSFQLETVTHLNADIATVLNMSPDHLDRHGNMAHYQHLKHKVFQGAKSIIINRDDSMTVPINRDSLINTNFVSIGSDAPSVSSLPVSSSPASSSLHTHASFGLITEEDGHVYLARACNKTVEKLINTNELKIKGQHNQLNALHALAIGELAGLTMANMIGTLKGFGGLEHRCQFIQTINGIDYFNDSKGTNIGSTMAAIKGLGESYTAADSSAKIVLILGGQGKGQDFSEMNPLINQFVSHIYFIGEDALNIENQLVVNGLSSEVHCKQTQTLDKAVTEASQLSTGSDVNNHTAEITIKALLLSPACASFDQFPSYTKRGERFIELVNQLPS